MAQARTILGLVIAYAGIALSFPLAPWGDVRPGLGGAILEWLYGWGWAPSAGPILIGRWVVQMITLSALALGAALIRLPTRPAPPWGVGAGAALAVGLLFLLEPLIHVLLLAITAVKPVPGSAELVFYAGRAIDPAWGRFWWQMAAMVVLPAVIEEWFFRGRLLPFLARGLGPVSAVSLSALLFAAGHGEPVQICIAVPIGVLLGWVYLATGRLYPCLIAHAVHNIVVLCIGGAMTASSVVVLVMLLGGAWLVAFAWAYHRAEDPRQAHRRFAWGATVALVAALAVWPLLRMVHHAAWNGAAWNLAAGPAPYREVVHRLAWMDRHRDLGGGRRDALVARLLAADEVDPRRRLVLLAILDPEAMHRLARRLHAAERLPAEGVYRDLLDLAEVHPHIGHAALLLADADPAAFADFCFGYRPPLARWFSLPEYADGLAAVIARLHGMRRQQVVRVLLTAAGYPPTSAARVLLRLPPEAVTGRDRYLLRWHVDNADALIAELARTDPTRAMAWGWVPEAVSP